LKEDLLIVSLGSNLGNRQNNLERALFFLNQEIGKLLSVSNVYESEPVGVTNHPPYLNLVATFATTLDPILILDITQNLEKKEGRLEKGDLKPRVIDIDLISMAKRQLRNSRLTLPHSAIQFRRFVLVPLEEVCPNWSHPQNGRSVSDLLNECSDLLWINKVSTIDLSLCSKLLS